MYLTYESRGGWSRKVIERQFERLVAEPKRSEVQYDEDASAKPAVTARCSALSTLWYAGVTRLAYAHPKSKLLF